MGKLYNRMVNFPFYFDTKFNLDSLLEVIKIIFYELSLIAWKTQIFKLLNHTKCRDTKFQFLQIFILAEFNFKVNFPF